ncbi:hypothetical protein PO909_007135 [Leuciscus waleckii]
MTKKTRDLRRQLRKAVMDHVSDSFLETNVPLLVLIEAAKNGNEKEVKEYAQVFREHANKLIEVGTCFLLYKVPITVPHLLRILNSGIFSKQTMEHYLYSSILAILLFNMASRREHT